MAFISRHNTDHLLVGYRPTKGAKTRYWRCPDEATLARFQAYEDGCRSSGVPVEDPAARFGEVPSPAARRAAKQQARARLHADRALPAPAAPAPPVKMTLAVWIGTPNASMPGPYFSYAKAMTEANRCRYEAVMNLYAKDIKDLPMDAVTWRDAHAIRDALVVCPSCRERAVAAGNKAVLLNPARLSAAATPWDGDGRCVDDDGGYDHYPALQRATMRHVLGMLRTAFRKAIVAGKNGQIGELASLSSNPFESINLPNFADRADDDDLRQALSPTQLQTIAAVMPPELEAFVYVGAYAMLRRSELIGLTRASVTWPTSPQDGAQALVRVLGVKVVERKRPDTFDPPAASRKASKQAGSRKAGTTAASKAGASAPARPWGKTQASTHHDVYLMSTATEALRRHVDRFCSTPNRKVCAACREGLGEHVGEPVLNRHRGCDFANDTPLWRTEAGRVAHPDTYSDIFERAAVAAGLTRETLGFKVTMKSLRSTGATLLLEAGVEPELVRRMGRWSNVGTLLKHYNRVRDAAKQRAAQQLDWHVRGELGLPGTEEAPVASQAMFLARRVEVLSARVAELEAYIAALDAGTFSSLSSPLTEPVRVLGAGLSRTAFDDAAVLAAAAACSSRRAMLEHIGVALASKNYRRLEVRARELGITLPAKYSTGPQQRTG